MTDATISNRFMPAEWSPHSACIILYPHNLSTFPRLEKAREQVLQVAQTIAEQGKERVWLICNTKETTETVRKAVQENHSNIVVSTCPSNDTWARDTAPTFCFCSLLVVDDDEKSSSSSASRRLVALDWRFNAYGGPEQGCYWPCDLDQCLAKRIVTQLPTTVVLRPETTTTTPLLQHESVSLILEGGSIHTDGEGTILTTAECLLHPNRNPTLSREQIETILLDRLGAQKVIWLPVGLAFDEDTNGHVDNFCCFSKPGHVILAWTDDAKGDCENYQRCRAAEAVLSQTTDARGRGLTVHKLHLPSPPLFYTKEEIYNGSNGNSNSDNQQEDNNHDATSAVERHVGQRLAASYVNFYVANQAVVVPQFGVPASDQRALETLEKLFDDRHVVGVPSREILLGGGNIHCITQQVPRLE